MSATREVITYAKRNGGVISTREAVALGLPKTTLNRRVEDGVLVRVGRGVLALPGVATRPDVMLRAACRILGAVVSHQSAAALHGLEPVEAATPTVTVSHRSTHTFRGVLVHQSTDLLPEHTVELNGSVVTNVARTLIDLAQVTKPKRLERVVDSTLAANKVAFDDLATLHESLSRQGKPGTRAMRRILQSRDGSLIPSDSELERLMVSLIREAGLPLPVSQFRAPWLKPQKGRIDFAYLEERVVVEADGRRWHVMFDAFEEDRRRDNAAQLAGWLVLRFTWRMIMNEPEMVASSIRGALRTLSRER